MNVFLGMSLLTRQNVRRFWKMKLLIQNSIGIKDSLCSGHGVWLDSGKCFCDMGYQGETCDSAFPMSKFQIETFPYHQIKFLKNIR